MWTRGARRRRRRGAPVVVALAAGALLVACAGEGTAPGRGGAAAPGAGVSTWRAAVGEPASGFPKWDERVILLWTNRARSDPQTDLAGCSDCPDAPCYSPKAPLRWSYELNRSARFHSKHQSLCGMTHDSRCTLVDTIGSDYRPGTCDGALACSCQSQACSCSGSCTLWDERIDMFGGSAGGENVAWMSSFNPVTMFYNWLHEDTTSAQCKFTLENGHRWNILMSSGPGLGVGCTDNYCTQDFGGPAAPASKIVVGVHYPATGTVAFRAHWYDTAAPSEALVNVDGTCSAMTQERGVSAANATYLLANQAISGCTRYFFRFRDATGTVVSYPETGSFGIGCATDWDETRPGLGTGCGVAAVDLLALRAARAPEGVRVTWRTGTETGCGVFVLLRCDLAPGACLAAGDFHEVPGTRQPCRGDAAGAGYEALDATAWPGRGYVYQLLELETSGGTQRYGSAVVAAETAAAPPAAGAGARPGAGASAAGTAPAAGCSVGGAPTFGLALLLVVGLARRRRYSVSPRR